MGKVVSRAKGSFSWGLHSEVLVLDSSVLFGNPRLYIYFLSLRPCWRPSHSGISPRAEGFSLPFLSQLFSPELLLTPFKVLTGLVSCKQSSLCFAEGECQRQPLNFEKQPSQLGSPLFVAKIHPVAREEALAPGLPGESRAACTCLLS